MDGMAWSFSVFARDVTDSEVILCIRKLIVSDLEENLDIIEKNYQQLQEQMNKLIKVRINMCKVEDAPREVLSQHLRYETMQKKRHNFLFFFNIALATRRFYNIHLANTFLLVRTT